MDDYEGLIIAGVLNLMKWLQMEERCRMQPMWVDHNMGRLLHTTRISNFKIYYAVRDPEVRFNLLNATVFGGKDLYSYPLCVRS